MLLSFTIHPARQMTHEAMTAAARCLF